MKLELSRPQADFLTSEAKSVAAVAGFGSGKTEIAMIRMLTTMFDYKKANMLYLAPTFPLIRDIWYPKVEEFLEDLGTPYIINKSEHTINLLGYGKIFCRTMEHPHRIIGFEVLDAFLDELDVLPEEKALEVWRKAKARCRQKVKKKKGRRKKLNQMFVTTTPEGFKATYQLFKSDPIPNSQLIQMSTYSNAHNLPDDYIDELKANYPLQLIEAYINGAFVNLVAMPVWNSYDPDKNNTQEFIQEREPLTVGMDFNVGRGCAVVYVERMGQLHAAGEVYNSYDTPDTIRVLEERYKDHHITVYPDASGNSRKSVNATTSDIHLLKQAGYDVEVRKKNPSIKDRVTATNAQFCNGLEERNAYVNKELCPRLSEALVKQVYDANGLPQKGAGLYDDMGDAASYPIAHLHPIRKLSTTSTEL